MAAFSNPISHISPFSLSETFWICRCNRRNSPSTAPTGLFKSCILCLKHASCNCRNFLCFQILQAKDTINTTSTDPTKIIPVNCHQNLYRKSFHVKSKSTPTFSPLIYPNRTYPASSISIYLVLPGGYTSFVLPNESTRRKAIERLPITSSALCLTNESKQAKVIGFCKFTS